VLNRISTTQKIGRKFAQSYRVQFRWCAAALLVLALFTLVYAGAYRYFAELENRYAQERAVFYRTTLESFLRRYQQLPYILGKDPHVITGLEGYGLEELNTRLKDFAHRAGLEAIFLMDTSGRTVAASNADAVPTFVGQNYAFRPYFQDASSGKTGQYFAVGTTTARPGYFIAEAVKSFSGRVLGVIVVKLDMLALQNAWQNRQNNILVSDSNGIVILASHERWLYRTMQALSPNQRLALRQSRQYGTHPLVEAEWTKTGTNSVLFENQPFLYAQTTLEKPGWTLHFLATTQRANERAISVGTILGALLASILALAFFVRSNRVRAALAVSEKANARLSAEIEERNALERRLANAQEELERKNKLATLGQLSAFVTHELGQPIAALKTYIAAQELKNGADQKTEPGFLKNVKSISERMDGITGQLRFFAQSPDRERELFDLRELETSVVSLVQHDIDAHDITFKSELSPQPVAVAANRLRLEQVLVNLMTNAISAVEGRTQRDITLSITQADKHALMIVADTGIGLNGTTLENLQEPFFTTRKSGKGLGLGLAIVSTIVHEHGGTLEASGGKQAGARFCVRIPLADDRVSQK